jgi:hypothetical protein
VSGDAVDVTDRYEAWLRRQTEIDDEHLAAKHRAMGESVFGFLRATFYLWAVRWREVCADVGTVPVVGVGDLHVENFGTWRDAEGRLAWGVNDFDEAAVVPYGADLVRLAVSAHLAIEEAQLQVDSEAACAAILAGYSRALSGGARPFVLEERNGKLRKMALGEMREPKRFWAKLDGQPEADRPPADATAIVVAALPEPYADLRLLQRVAGVGSLGRTRVTAVATHHGSRLAREVKALLPSAWTWAAGAPDPDERRRCAEQLLAAPLRCPDPCVTLHPDWVVRRLAPHVGKVTLDALADRTDQLHLLKCMGRETAQLHLATKGAAEAVAGDLKKLPEHWLHDAAAAMGRTVHADWEAWTHR